MANRSNFDPRACRSASSARVARRRFSTGETLTVSNGRFSPSRAIDRPRGGGQPRRPIGRSMRRGTARVRAMPRIPRQYRAFRADWRAVGALCFVVHEPPRCRHVAAGCGGVLADNAPSRTASLLAMRTHVRAMTRCVDASRRARESRQEDDGARRYRREFGAAGSMTRGGRSWRLPRTPWSPPPRLVGSKIRWMRATAGRDLSRSAPSRVRRVWNAPGCSYSVRPERAGAGCAVEGPRPRGLRLGAARRLRSWREHRG